MKQPTAHLPLITEQTRRVAVVRPSRSRTGEMRSCGVDVTLWTAETLLNGQHQPFRVYLFNHQYADDSHQPIDLTGASLVIADVTAHEPEVMEALSEALKRGLPTIQIGCSPEDVAHRQSDRTVLITGASGGMGRGDEVTAARIAEATGMWLSPGRDGSRAAKPKREKIFISYCHRDGAYLDRLLVHLKPLQWDGRIDPWSDQRLRPGDQWKEEIRVALRAAQSAVLLVSADFLASDFVNTEELPKLLQQAAVDGTRILPIIVGHCRFSRDLRLAKFQAFNDPKTPLSSMQEWERERIFDEVGQLLEAEIESQSASDQLLRRDS